MRTKRDGPYLGPMCRKGHDHKGTGKSLRHKTGAPGFLSAVRMWPTPVATAHKGWSAGHNRADTDDRLDYTIERQANQSGTTGRLNPEFVEYLMGWPIGHTGLEPVATARFQEWLLAHSPCSPPNSKGDA